MIDWIKSAELNNCTIEWLKDWFEKYPSSNKKVWRICEGERCNDKREVSFYAITELCKKCAANTPEHLNLRSKLSTQYYVDHPEAGKAHSKYLTQWYIDHPEEREARKLGSNDQWDDQETRNDQSKRKIEYWSDPTNRDAQSERITNSESCKAEHERQRGGNDLVDHHYIYDHSDLSKYTMKVTRKKHTLIHHWMRKAGIKIPHINIKSEEEST